MEYNEEELLNKIFEQKPKEIEYLGCNAFKYRDLFIELRPETYCTENEIPEIDFAIFETEEDMNTDYELNLGVGFFGMKPAYNFWRYVKLYCYYILK